MHKLLLSLCITAWLAPTPCLAARVYRLVDRPANQEGHSLNGAITTTDDAPLDGLLDVAEIVDWQYSVQGAHPTTASAHQFSTDGTKTIGVRITAAGIELPPATSAGEFSQLLLSRHDPGFGRGPFGHRLSWSAGYDEIRGPALFSGASSLGGDVILSRWSSVTPHPGTAALVIAHYLPDRTRRYGIRCVVRISIRSNETTPVWDVADPRPQ